MRVDRAAFRKSRNYAIAEASEMAGPMLRVLGRAAARGAATDAACWRRGLVIGHNHVGDVLHRSCSLHQLRAAFPECAWDYLTSPSAADVLRGNPAIATVLPFAADDHSWPVSPAAFSALRSARYDVVLCTSTVRHAVDLALAAALRAPNRVAFAGKGYSGLATTVVPLEYPQAAPAYFRAMIGEIAGLAPDWSLRPRVFPGAADRTAAAHYWATLSVDRARPVVACAVTTRQSVGCWPAEFFARTLTAAAARRPISVVLFGDAKDAATLHQVAESLPCVADVAAGTLRWLEFACVLQRCDVLLAMDSGPRHLANAVGTPVAYTRNLATSRVEAGCYCANEVDLAPPDAEYLSPRSIDAASRRVSPDAAAARMLELLERRSAGWSC